MKSSILQKMGRISALQKTWFTETSSVYGGFTCAAIFFSAAKHAMAKLISFTEDFTSKKGFFYIFNQFASSKALMVVSWRSGRGGRWVGNTDVGVVGLNKLIIPYLAYTHLEIP